MKMSDIPEEAWKSRASPIPTKLVPDFPALFDVLDTQGWLVLEPPALDHRETPQGAFESKVVKDFKNWMISNKSLMLNARRIGQYRWYLVIGSPWQRRKANKGEK
tara:strand:- start:3509 stop:3823 length:315 start_codon:yes stop_codon:yes gene_type:complete